MKKEKIVALLGLSVLSIGVLAGGAIALSEDSFSSLQAAEVVNGKCGLTFDKSARPTLVNGEGYAQDGHVRLKYNDAEDDDTGKGNVCLYQGGCIYTDATPYSASTGWGSVTNGISKIDVEFVNGKVQLYTAYTLKLDGTPNWPPVFEKAQATNFSYTVEESYPPRYLKVEAVEYTTIASLKIVCTALDSVETSWTPDNGSLAVNIAYSITPDIEEENNHNFTGRKIKFNNDELTFPRVINANGELDDTTLYKAGENSMNEIIYVDSKDKVQPNKYYVSKGKEGTLEKIRIGENDLFTIDESKPRGDGNLYYISATGFMDSKPCTSLTVKFGNSVVAEGSTKPAPNGKEFVYTVETNKGVTDPVIWTFNESGFDVKRSVDNRTLKLTGTAFSGTDEVTVSCGYQKVSFKIDHKWVYPSELKNAKLQFKDSISNEYLKISIDARSNVTFTSSKFTNTINMGKGVVDATKPGKLNYVNASGTGVTKAIFGWDGTNLTIEEYEDSYNHFKGLVGSVGEPIIQSYKNRSFHCYLRDKYDFDFNVIGSEFVDMTFGENTVSVETEPETNKSFKDCVIPESAITKEGTLITVNVDFPEGIKDSTYDYFTFTYNEETDVFRLTRFGKYNTNIDGPCTEIL